jgi:hypothetical protein
MYPLEAKSYSAALRAKAGEFLACLELDEPSKERLLPDFILPPLTAKENGSLSIEGAMDAQIGKISTYWGARPCLLDLRFLKFNSDAGVDASYVTDLLVRARRSGCRVIPVVDLITNYYRVAAVGAHARNSKSGAALRLTLHDLSNRELKPLIDTQLANLGISSNECVLILDLSDADLSAPDEFAKFASDWLHRLQGYGMWPRMIFQATNYPLHNPAPAKGQKSVARAEWSIWKRIIELDAQIKNFVMFGDFGADNAHIDFEADGRAITHLRYATETCWLVVRGDKMRKTIRSVADRIVKSGSFSGELFSVGDEFIGTRAQGLAGVGNPMIWRSVNMNHHMTLVIQGLGILYGAPVPQFGRRRHPVQEELLPALPEPADSAV